MTKSDGVSKIDAVQVGELSFISIGPPTPVLTVKYAYANAKTGDRYGYGNLNQNWSDETMERLSKLVESVEKDLLSRVFGDGTTSGVSSSPSDTTDGVPSL